METSPACEITNVNQLTHMKLIGEGAVAKVYRGYYRDPATQKWLVYAVK